MTMSRHRWQWAITDDNEQRASSFVWFSRFCKWYYEDTLFHNQIQGHMCMYVPAGMDHAHKLSYGRQYVRSAFSASARVSCTWLLKEVKCSWMQVTSQISALNLSASNMDSSKHHVSSYHPSKHLSSQLEHGNWSDSLTVFSHTCLLVGSKENSGSSDTVGGKQNEPVLPTERLCETQSQNLSSTASSVCVMSHVMSSVMAHCVLRCVISLSPPRRVKACLLHCWFSKRYAEYLVGHANMLERWEHV